MKKLLLIVLFIVGCNNSTQPNTCSNCIINGHVTDSDGNPLDNAAILLTFDSGMNRLTRMQMPSTTFTYALSEESSVLIWIADMCDDTVKVLVNANQSAGNYSITWICDDLNGNTVVDGIYKARLAVNDLEIVNNLLLIQDYFPTIEGQNYHAMTDEDGYFSISGDCLPFGVEYEAADAQGGSLGSFSVPFITKLWVVHGDNSTFETEWYAVDSNTGLHVDIQVP